MKIQLLCDNPKSWMVSYAVELESILLAGGHECKLMFDAAAVEAGDVLILLSCEKIFKALHLNKHNLVIHESPLPEGKGWSPLTWQILEGKNIIPVTLFEAAENVDSGNIYGQENIDLNGLELVNELRAKQAEITKKLVLGFVAQYPDNISKEQTGYSTFYPRRKPEHSKLDIHKTIDEQFNLLRVCDNERYPAWFEKGGEEYILKIEKK